MNRIHKVKVAPEAQAKTGISTKIRMTKVEFEKLAEFRYQLRRFLRFSEEVTHASGVTALQYQLLLQIKGFPGREWATVGELAERLQAKHHGVVALLTRCESIGLVTRRVSESDRRSVEIRLTSQGNVCVERLARAHRSELASLYGQFSVPNLRPVNPTSGASKAGRATRCSSPGLSKRV